MTDSQLQLFITNDKLFAENGYLVYFRDGGPCWIVDPGLPPQAERMIAVIGDRGLMPDAVVLTHAHADHIAGVDDVLAAVGDVPVYLARQEWGMLADAGENLSAGMGMPVTAKTAAPRDLEVGSTLELDATQWVVGDVSGHSPGGRSLYCAEHGVVLVGDALFAGSIGRVDFPHSNGEQLLSNIHDTLMTLPDETRVLSGHGPETTIGAERRSNPFILHGL